MGRVRIGACLIIGTLAACGGGSEAGRPAVAPADPAPAPVATAAPAELLPCDGVELEAWSALGEPRTAQQACTEAVLDSEEMGCELDSFDEGWAIMKTTSEHGEEAGAVLLRSGQGWLDLGFGSYSSGAGYEELVRSVDRRTIGSREVVSITLDYADDMRDGDGEEPRQGTRAAVCVVDGARRRCLVNSLDDGVSITVDDHGIARFSPGDGAPLRACLQQPFPLW